MKIIDQNLIEKDVKERDDEDNINHLNNLLENEEMFS